jgi:hypothetical protein
MVAVATSPNQDVVPAKAATHSHRRSLSVSAAGALLMGQRSMGPAFAGTTIRVLRRYIAALVEWAEPPGRANAHLMTGSASPPSRYPRRRWARRKHAFATSPNQGVVPAKAGTHNHRRSLSVSAAGARLMGQRGMGPGVRRDDDKSFASLYPRRSSPSRRRAIEDAAAPGALSLRRCRRRYPPECRNEVRPVSGHFRTMHRSKTELSIFSVRKTGSLWVNAERH